MDLLRLSFFILLALIGYIKCTDPDEIAYCDKAKLIPCQQEAVRAYTRSTRGEEAAQGDINPQDALTVGLALDIDISSPDLNMNETCKVLRKAEYLRFIDCVIVAETGCRSPPGSEEKYPDTIPSIRQCDLRQLRSFDTDFCAEGCLSYEYKLKAKMAELVRCWKACKPALAAAAEGGDISLQYCRVLSGYMQCQWDNSVGCTIMEEITRAYLLTLTGTIAECDIQLPRAALKKPSQAIDPPTVGGCVDVTPVLAVQLSVLLLVTCVITICKL